MLESLAYIRALAIDHQEVINEAKEIRDYDNWHIVHGSTKLWNIFTQPSLRKRTFNVFIPYLAQQFTGVGLITVSLSMEYS